MLRFLSWREINNLIIMHVLTIAPFPTHLEFYLFHRWLKKRLFDMSEIASRPIRATLQAWCLRMAIPPLRDAPGMSMCKEIDV